MSFCGLNKLCDIRDFSDEYRRAAIRELEPEYVRRWPTYPTGMEHRKSWEYAQLIAGLDALGVVTRESLVLAVSPGADRAHFALTRRARLVFAAGLFAGTPAARMLTEPEALSSSSFDRRRLIVQHMAPTDLRYEDETFDVVYSLGAGGGPDSVHSLLSGMARVCRTGGLVMLTLECAVDGTAGVGGPLSIEQVGQLLRQHPSLQPLESLNSAASEETRRSVRSMDRVVADLKKGHTEYPHIVLEDGGCRFTSLSLFLRKGRVDG